MKTSKIPVRQIYDVTVGLDGEELEVIRKAKAIIETMIDEINDYAEDENCDGVGPSKETYDILEDLYAILYSYMN